MASTVPTASSTSDFEKADTFFLLWRCSLFPNLNYILGKGREADVSYFGKLDEELNKVDMLYKDQVEEVICEELNKDQVTNPISGTQMRGT